MAKHQNSRTTAVPRGWPQYVKSAMLHVIALAQYTVAYMCPGSASAPSRNAACQTRQTAVQPCPTPSHLRGASG
ncbi:MAG: hypothetical protein ACYSUQ_15425 [Planctomycetota bacterium]|jgi:hypothetical protein